MIRTIEWLPEPKNDSFELRQDFERPEDAAALLDISVEELLWAIEEYGRADVPPFTAWEPSEEAGEEYPTSESPHPQNYEMAKVKKRLLDGARRFWEGAESPGEDIFWLFANLVNRDEGEMENLLEKYKLEYDK